MFLIEAVQQFIEAFSTYFSYMLLFLISVPIAIVRSYQTLFRERLTKWWQFALEVVVEAVRLVQYVIVLAKGTDIALSSLLESGSAWGEMFAGIRMLRQSEAIWEFIGFLIIFLLYNAVLKAVFRQSFVAALMSKFSWSRFEAPAMQAAALIAIKNLFLIPVSVIYIFQILHFI
ncbi:hypothetical protein [Paenibacillus sp. HJGM_3]|uniref:hypothetical protein n=1 Tax=Paenibacillus sp. HJGM_3 TaxID=3379816 RepID=UPI00385806DE